MDSIERHKIRIVFWIKTKRQKKKNGLGKKKISIINHMLHGWCSFFFFFFLLSPVYAVTPDIVNAEDGVVENPLLRREFDTESDFADIGELEGAEAEMFSDFIRAHRVDVNNEDDFSERCYGHCECSRAKGMKSIIYYGLLGCIAGGVIRVLYSWGVEQGEATFMPTFRCGIAGALMAMLAKGLCNIACKKYTFLEQELAARFYRDASHNRSSESIGFGDPVGLPAASLGQRVVAMGTNTVFWGTSTDVFGEGSVRSSMEAIYEEIPGDDCDRSSTGTIYEEMDENSVESIPFIDESDSDISESSLAFSQGYDHGTQTASLLGMQCMLTNIAGGVPQNLRKLAFKAYEKIPKQYENIQSNHKEFRASLRKETQGMHKALTETRFPLLQERMPYQIFTSMDEYTSNLESKSRSSQAGVITECIPHVHIGVTYTHQEDIGKEYGDIQLDTGRSLVQARAKVTNVAAVVTFNPDKRGPTGQLISCYGWGKIKHKRYVTHAGSEVVSKGSPHIMISGGLAQVGYNIPFKSTVFITPYAEAVWSTVRWKTYNESVGMLPCNISGTREFVLEKSIGIRGHVQVGRSTVFQPWIAGVSTHQTSSCIRSRPLLASFSRDGSVTPEVKGRFIRAQGGVSCSSKMRETLSVGGTASCVFEKSVKKYNHQFNVYLQYVY